MARLVLNRDGGKTDEFGHILGLSRFLQGEVIEGLDVTAQSSPNMTVKVAAGSAKIPYGSAGTRYSYWVANDADYNVTIATADPANPRIDYVIGVVDRTVTPSTASSNNPNNMFKIIAVAGTPAASPSVPSGAQLQAAAGTGNPYIILRRVNVGTGITQITAAQIGTDMRQFVYAGRLSADGLINTALIADLAVTSAKIANSTLTPAKTDWSTFPRFMVRRTAALSPGAGVTTIVFNSVVHNNFGSAYNNTTGTYTVPVTGYYFVAARISAGSNQRIFIDAFVNGTSIGRGQDYANTTPGAGTSLALGPVLLNANDQLQIRLYMASGGAIETGANAWFSAFMTGQ